MKYKTLIFDLDGTLLNTITDLATAVNYALTKHGYPTHTEAAILRMVGNGVELLVARALPGGTENPEFPAVLSDFRAYYEVHKMDATAPYAGIPELLDTLAATGVPMAIVSNKFDAAVRELAVRFFATTLRVAVGESETVAKKPAPDAVFAALRELGVTAEGAVFIGDSEVDIKTAQNAGLPSLSVGWGFRTEADLIAAGAARVFATPAELGEYLLAD
ncbi:MAG: HAD-IA family hydrolase [Clostridia bacterium]|nr:HAD-IA family hydrolase [Clostridia bacterium]